MLLLGNRVRGAAGMTLTLVVLFLTILHAHANLWGTSTVQAKVGQVPLDPRGAEMLNIKATASILGSYSDVPAGAVGGAGTLWDANVNGTGELISIADSGVDVDSCFFADYVHSVALYPAVNYAHRKIVSYHGCNVKARGGGGGGAGVWAGAQSLSLATLNSSAFPRRPPFQRQDGSFTFYAGRGDSVSGHGTHVAGCAAGSVVGPPTTGLKAPYVERLSRYNGVAPGAKLFVYALSCQTPTAVEGDGEVLPLPSDITAVFSVAYATGARISSNSWGFPSSATSYVAAEKLVDQFAHDHDDMLLLFAAGNSPKVGLYSPGTAKNVLTVGAHMNAFHVALMNNVASFSAYGPTYDGRAKPDLVGPGGGGVRSAEATAVGGSRCTVGTKAGTSMATALVAGAAALLRQFLREQLALPSPSSALMKGLLIHGTVGLSREGAVDMRAGFGRLDLSLVTGSPDTAKLTAGPSTSPSAPRSVRTSRGWGTASEATVLWLRDRVLIGDREAHTYCFTLSPVRTVVEERRDRGARAAGAPAAVGSPVIDEVPHVRATLTWTDPPLAEEGASRSLVNDLDLVLVAANGTLFYPHPADPTQVYFDRVSNVEQVRVHLSHIAPPVTPASVTANPRPELLRVVVYGHDVRHGQVRGQQPYSIAVSAPGLRAYESCQEAFAAAAPTATGGAANPQGAPLTVTPAIRCPGDCSGAKGRCVAETGQCECAAGFRFVDCSQCNDAVVCHRRGTCVADTLTCQCDPGTHFRDAHCSVCEEGWFGPRCDRRCECKNGGVCNTQTGECACLRDLNHGGSGCFNGTQCGYCCEGFGGPLCSERSYWCDPQAAVLVDDVDGGLIQVNGYETYPYSVTCRWEIVAPPFHTIALSYLKYDIESPYDALFLYDTDDSGRGSSSSGGTMRLVRKDTGRLQASREGFSVVSAGRSLLLEFVSDWAEAREGFLLRYRFLPHSSCGGRCSPAADGLAASHATTTAAGADRRICGEVVGLPGQCVCRPPFFGRFCNLSGDVTTSTAAPDALFGWVGNAGEGQTIARNVRAAFYGRGASGTSGGESERGSFVAETLVSMDELGGGHTAGPAVAAPAWAPAQTRLAVNGLTLLVVQTLFNSSATRAAWIEEQQTQQHRAAWAVELAVSLHPRSPSLLRAQRLSLGVAQVHHLHPQLQTSNISSMALLDMDAEQCADAGAPTAILTVPLQVPRTMEYPGGTSHVQYEGKVLLSLLWPDTTGAAAAAQLSSPGDAYSDAVVVVTRVLRLGRPTDGNGDDDDGGRRARYSCMGDNTFAAALLGRFPTRHFKGAGAYVVAGDIGAGVGSFLMTSGGSYIVTRIAAVSRHVASVLRLQWVIGFSGAVLAGCAAGVLSTRATTARSRLHTAPTVGDARRVVARCGSQSTESMVVDASSRLYVRPAEDLSIDTHRHTSERRGRGVVGQASEATGTVTVPRLRTRIGVERQLDL